MKRPALSERSESKRPPLAARALMRICVPAHLRDAIAGDVEEQWCACARRSKVYWSGARRSIVDCWRGRLRYAREESRQSPRGDGVIRSIGQDTRFAARMMFRNRGFARIVRLRPWTGRFLVLRQGLGLAFVGVGAGIAGSVAVTRLLETLLFGPQPTDPFTYAGAALLFMTVAALASSVPALRAATIDPAITLRAD